MIKITDFFNNQIEKPTAITVGKFDGLHRGHELLLQNILSQEPDLKSCMLTFPSSPKNLLDGEQQRNLITPEEREYDLKRKGLSYLMEVPFTKEFSELTPEDFIRQLVERFSMKYMTCGTDFTFGRFGKGDVTLLHELAEKYNFQLVVEEKLEDDQEDISSTRIRRLISEGNMEKVQELLGYPYFVWGEIVHGNHIGTGMGVPTINQIPDSSKLLPRNGVYVTEVEIDHKFFHGITNVGEKPTVQDSHQINVETFILDFKDNVYEKEAKVVFCKFVRPEQKFASLTDLKNQIKKDTEFAFSYFNKSK